MFTTFYQKYVIELWQLGPIYSFVLSAMLLTLLGIAVSYIKSLLHTPRELWLLYGVKVTENAAYAAVMLIMMMWLNLDCGMSDAGSSYLYGLYSAMLSVLAILSGSLVDSMGIRRTLIFGTVFLLVSRLCMSFVTNPWLLVPLVFVPTAMGYGMMNPVISVGIKRYTTKAQSALGFALFYLLLNVAFAIANMSTDALRNIFALKDAAGKVINENYGFYFGDFHMSTYQIVILVSAILSVVCWLLLLCMRKKVYVEGVVVDEQVDHNQSGVKMSAWEEMCIVLAKSGKSMLDMMKSACKDRYFWYFISIIGAVVFTRLVFIHFHITFPKYGLRVWGQGAPIGAVYGVLNPIIIVFSVPVVAYFCKKAGSYWMLLIGTTISSLACFLTLVPQEKLAWLSSTSFGEFIFKYFLNISQGDASYWPMILCVLVFSLGEAIWSPRLMQFSADIAPKGREGTYLALSILPYFLAKLLASPMSGWLLEYYTPVEKVKVGGQDVEVLLAGSNPVMIWAWVGATAVITPILLLLLRPMFKSMLKMREQQQLEEEQQQARTACDS